MKMIPDEYAFVLSTGRRVYCSANRLSIGDEGDVCYGSDGMLEPGEPGPFTAEERKEIAAEAIARWQRWAEGSE